MVRMPGLKAVPLGLLLLALPGLAAEKQDPCAAASSTSDVRFELALKDHGAIFQAGEIVPLALSFSSSIKGRYTAADRNYDRSGRLGEEQYCVEPEAADPLESYFKAGAFIGGGIGGIRLLDETPFTANAELNEWRSLAPGHYRVYAISHRVSRPRDAHEETPNSHVGQLPGEMELQWQFFKPGRISPAVTMEKQEAVYEGVRTVAAEHGIAVGKGNQ
jgi:hypothetical protein